MGDEEFTLEPGVAVFIPGDVPHGQRCTGHETLNIVAVIAPPFAQRLERERLAAEAGSPR